MLHLQKVVGGPLNVLADVVAVCRTIKKRSQDEHVQRALQEIGALRCLSGHGRRSTLTQMLMVDNRPSVVNGGRGPGIQAKVRAALLYNFRKIPRDLRLCL
jgi:hypothetical protein